MRFPRALFALIPLVLVPLALAQPPRGTAPIDVEPKPITSDKSVKLDYDIVYVRMPRKGDDVGTNWPEISNPVFMDAGADLMLLHPNGTEELLVGGGGGAVTDARSAAAAPHLRNTPLNCSTTLPMNLLLSVWREEDGLCGGGALVKC